jgi:hypothetical protein
MAILKNKIATIAIAIFLTFSMGASIMLLPSASAHTPPWNLPTYAYIWASPNPVGVNQTASVYMWLTNYYYGSAVGNDLTFNGYEFTITAPNGAVTTQTFNHINPTSAQFTDFVPTQLGTYNLTFTFPGQVYTQTTPISLGPGLPVGPNPYTNDTFLPARASTNLTVQTTPIAAPLTGAPLPTAYWTRPIYGENTLWYTIASNWLGIGSPNYGGWMDTGGDALSGPFTGMAIFPGDAVGSQTSHIMWTKPLQSGGVVGGNNVAIAGDTYFDGSAYIIRYNNPIILDGMLYYTEPIGFSATGYWESGLGQYNPETGSGYGPTVCVNLQTGQQIWSSTSVPALDFGYIQSVDTPNEHGVNPPILVAQIPVSDPFGSTWMLFDGDTGLWLGNVTNVPVYTAPELGSPPSPWAEGSARAMGPDGNYLDYVFANLGTAAKPNWDLAEWNSSLLFLPVGAEAPTFTGVFNGGLGSDYDWNVSVPYLNTNTVPFVVIQAQYGDGILCMNGTMPSNGENELYSWDSQAPYTYFFVNLNATVGAVGSVLWSSTLQPPANNYTVVQGPVDWTTGVFMQDYKEAVQWVGYSLTTGKYLWTAPPQAALDYYGSTSEGTLPGAVAYGHLYSCGYAGIIYCYNDLTGQLLWTYGNGGAGNSTNSGFNWPYGNIPTEINAIGNGVVYTVTSAHTWPSPIYKDGLERAINATTGQQIWTLSGVTIEFGEMSYAMADGYNTWFNGYDDQIYVVGRGPSQTTVTAPDVASPLGVPVVIRGTVMDIAAGTKQTEQAADFPNGVPCASDASMSAWMSYVYQQQPEPTNFTGVPVTITVTDSNHNTYAIGTVTTDTSGCYSLSWKPIISSNFTVYATFAGNNGYYGSCAESSFTVTPAAATPAPTASPPTGLASTASLELGVAVIAVIIIIIGAVIILLMLRKRP